MSTYEQEHQIAERQRRNREGTARKSSVRIDERKPWSPLYQDHDGGWWVNDRYFGADHAAAVEAMGARP